MSYKYADYKAVEWFDGNEGLIMGDITVDELIGGLLQLEVITPIDIYNGNLDRISLFDYMVIRKENFDMIGVRGTPVSQLSLSLETYNRYDGSSSINLVYNNQENVIFSTS